MTHCVKCGSRLDEGEAACGKCGWDAEASREGVLRRRSDGSSFIGFGWCGVAFGLISSLIGMFPTSGYDSGYGVATRTYHWGWAMLGGALINVGLLLLLAGFIIRALWFLPGPAHKPVPGSRVGPRPEPPAVSPLTRPGNDGAQV